jgi:hypothetical protein
MLRACFSPITWPEPFGLSMIEAMTCGTPVVAMGISPLCASTKSLVHSRDFRHLLGASGQPPTPEYGSPKRPRRTRQMRTLSSVLG